MPWNDLTVEVPGRFSFFFFLFLGVLGEAFSMTTRDFSSILLGVLSRY